MKPKEIVQLAVALVIFGVAGVLIYSQVGPKKSAGPSKGAEIVKVTAVNPQFNQDALTRLTDDSKSKDFYTAPDLKSGLGNNQPFGPLR